MLNKMVDSLIKVAVLFCAIRVTESTRSDIRRLQSKVDLFIDTVLDINHNIRELREIVNDLENQNATCGCDQQQSQVQVQTQSLEDTTDHLSSSVESFMEEFNLKLVTLQRGFRKEKHAMRTKLENHGKSIGLLNRKVNDIDTALPTDVSTELHKLSVGQEDINATCERHAKDIVSEVKKLSGELNKLKLSVSQISSAIQDGSGLKGKAFEHMDDLRAFGTSVYKFHEEEITWTEAQQKCQEDGFHLAEINDEKEHEFLKELIGNYWRFAWLGSTDTEKEGDWRWATSGTKIMSSLWNEGEPNNDDGNEDCMHYYGSRHSVEGLNDAKCGNKYSFVCEFELP